MLVGKGGEGPPVVVVCGMARPRAEVANAAMMVSLSIVAVGLPAVGLRVTGLERVVEVADVVSVG